MAEAAGAKLIVIFIDQNNIFKPERWEDSHKKDFLDLLVKSGVVLFDISGEMLRSGGKKLFRDSTHPNQEGNKVIAEAIAKIIKGSVNK